MRRLLLLPLLLFVALAGEMAKAQQSPPVKTDYSRNPEWFPRIYQSYRTQKVSAPDLKNSASVAQTIRDGRIALSLAALLAVVVENNLDLAIARYNNSFAETDVLRARSGQAARGVEGARIPSGLFAGALGAGLGGGGGRGGGGGGDGGGITGSARQVFVGPRGSFDPFLGLNFSMDRSESPLNTLRVVGVRTAETHTTALRVFYNQAFTTGTSFGLGFNVQRRSSNERFLLFNPSLTTGFSFSINQQLLNGFGFAVNRRFLKVAENGQHIAREFFRQQVIAKLAQAQNLYWDLVAAQERVRTAEQALTVAQRLYEDNKKQAEIGTLAPLDVVAAEAEVAARRRDLIVAQTNWQMREVELKNLFSKETDPALGAARVETTDALPEPQDADIPAWEEAAVTALRNRPELRQAEGNLLNQEVAVQFTQQRLKPTFNVFGVVESSARSGDLAGAFGQLGRWDFPEYAFGFSLTIPLLNRSAQADDLRARLEQRQAETALQRTRNLIQVEVRNAVIGLVQAKAQVEAARKAVERSRQTLDAEEKKLRAGVSTPYSVIRVQRDLFSAQLAEVQARVNYGKAQVEMDRATGVLLERHHIDLDEALAGRLSHGTLAALSR